MGELNHRVIIIDEGMNSLIFFDLDNCLYRCKSTRGEIKYLECSEAGCPVRGKLVNGGLFERTNLHAHNHQNNHQVRADYESAFERLRSLVKEQPGRSVKDLYNEVVRVLPLEVASLLCWENCRQTLQRIRNRLFPPCSSLEDLEALLEDMDGPVFAQYGQHHGQNFYVGSAGGQLMFANLHLIDQLPDLVDLFIDGTFGVTPFKARQLLVVLAELQGRPRPIFYAIMKAQTVDHYEMLFHFISDVLLGDQRRVLTATSDFEQSIRVAVLRVWPQSEVVGCNFHHCQALERRAKQLSGLAGGKLASGTVHRKVLLMYMRLSLLPLRRIATGFASLLDFIQDQGNDHDIEFDADDFDEFSEYFQSTWIIRFSPATWCVSDRDRRTNNNVEGYNRKIKDTINPNPSPWAFLQGLKDLMNDASGKFERDKRNNAVTPADRSRLSKPLAAALHCLIADEIDELEFLKVMAAS